MHTYVIVYFFPMNDMCSNVLQVKALGDHLLCHMLPVITLLAYNCYQKVLSLKVSGISSLICKFPFHKHPQIIIPKQEKLLLYNIHYKIVSFSILFLIIPRKSTFHIIFLIKIRYCYVVHRIQKKIIIKANCKV